MDRRTTSAFYGASPLLDHGVRDQLRLGWRLLRDERVSSLKYVLPALLTVYVVSPVDPIPDFLLGIGQMDDLGVVIGGVLLLARLIPKLAAAHIVDEHLRDMHGSDQPVSGQTMPNEKPIDARFNVRA